MMSTQYPFQPRLAASPATREDQRRAHYLELSREIGGNTHPTEIVEAETMSGEASHAQGRTLMKEGHLNAARRPSKETATEALAEAAHEPQVAASLAQQAVEADAARALDMDMERPCVQADKTVRKEQARVAEVVQLGEGAGEAQRRGAQLIDHVRADRHEREGAVREARQARAAEISQLGIQAKHALLPSTRIIAQVRGVVNCQRETAEDEPRRIREALAAKIETLRAEVATALRDTVHEARVAAQTEAADAYDVETARWRAEAARERDVGLRETRAAAETEAAATLAAEKARWKDETEQAVSAALKQAHAEADDRFASRERQWQAKVAQTQEAAIQTARATVETEATATLAAEKARWKDETEQAVAAALKQAHAEADDRFASRGRQRKDDAPRNPDVVIPEARSRVEAELANEQARHDPRDLNETPASTNGNDLATATPDGHEALDEAGPDAESKPDDMVSDLPIFFRELVSDVPQPATGWRRLI